MFGCLVLDWRQWLYDWTEICKQFIYCLPFQFWNNKPESHQTRCNRFQLIFIRRFTCNLWSLLFPHCWCGGGEKYFHSITICHEMFLHGKFHLVSPGGGLGLGGASCSPELDQWWARVRAGSLQPPPCRGQPWTHPRQCAVCRVCVTCGVCMVCGVWCDMKVLVHCQSASGQVAAAAGPVAPAAAPPHTTATTTWHQHQHHRATSYLTMLLSLGRGRSQIKLSFTINKSKFSGMVTGQTPHSALFFYCTPVLY